MRRNLLIITAAIALSACATVATEDADDQTSAAPVVVCPVVNPDGTCACEEVDENGECVEGGGTGVIIPGGGTGVIIPSETG